MTRRLPVSFTVTVTGVTFAPHYPRNVYEVQKWYVLRGKCEARLERELDNEHDPNAVKVGALTPNGLIELGHLPRDVAARVAPELDAGTRWTAAIESMGEEVMGRPWVSVRLWRAA